MAKNDKSVEPLTGATDDIAAELRDLVKGGAEYERGRAPGKPVTLSKIVAQYSEERRTPSYAGLPKWKVTAPGIAAGKEHEPEPNTGTDPGLGPGSAEMASELMTTQTGHETTVQLPLEGGEANTLVDGLPTADVSAAPEEPASEAALNRGPVITIPNKGRDEWAAAIASQVRGGAPAKPYRSSKEEAPAPTPAVETQPPSIVEARKAARSAETVPVKRAKLDDEVPEAPPVESRREEKRTERRIGLTAAFAATLIVGMLLGRWVWMKNDGTKPVPTASQALGVPAPVTSPWVPTVAPQASVTISASSAVAVPVTPAPVAPPASAPVKAHGPKHGVEPGHTAEPAVTVPPVVTAPSVTVAPVSTPAPTPSATASSRFPALFQQEKIQ